MRLTNRATRHALATPAYQGANPALHKVTKDEIRSAAGAQL